MLRLLCLLAILWAPQATAGAWPRGKDRVFVSALTYATQLDSYTGIYAEWGMSDRLTFGVDIGRAVSGKEKVVLFLHRPLDLPLGAARLSFGIGAGQIAGQTVLRPGLSWGRGITLGDRVGWLALDLIAEVDTDSRSVDAKSDATFGLSWTDRITAMLQLQGALEQGDEPVLRVVPSLAFDMGQGKKVEFGLTQSLRGPRETGIKLALWLDF